MQIFTELSDAEALAHGLLNLDVAQYEKELDAFLEELEFDLWLKELEEAAVYRELIASYRYNYPC